MTASKDTSQPDCACGTGCNSIDRREFLKSAGISLATVSSAIAGLPVMAGPFERPGPGIEHFVPADKRLKPEWLAALRQRGERHAWRGAALNTIGMPVGGIAAGQLYLCGDGTLGCWQIFRERYFSGWGANNYRASMPERTVDQGFAVVLEDVSGAEAQPEPRPPDESPRRPIIRELNRQGFPDVEFNGEYPIGTLRYSADDLPVRVTMEAFSPFIPLNAKDSALPATVFHFTIENTSERSVRVGLLGWLENAVCFHSNTAYKLEGRRGTSYIAESDRAFVVHRVEPSAHDENPTRPDIVLAEFEGDSYGEWKAEGTAVGKGPAHGTLAHQNPVTGFIGSGLVNTYLGGDNTTGTLTSPSFTIERRYLHFLIGGGGFANETCINLRLGERVIRTATGHENERLEWECWDVREFEGQTATIQIVDSRKGGWGHINVDQIVQTDRPRYGKAERIEQLEDFGTMVLALAGPSMPWDDTRKLVAGKTDADFVQEPDSQYALGDRRRGLLAAPVEELAPGAKREHTFVLAWHFPNREQGEMYANHFADARKVAAYVLDNRERLVQGTRLWHDTYYDSTLPYWLLDRLHMPVSTLATGTCHWWKSGRFWAWEGVGCCEGTCTHVWNYAHAPARLFPELERSVRDMQDLGEAFHDDGLVDFRGKRSNAYAADGQAGTVLKCYREHLMSPDDAFLRSIWPRAQKVLEYLIAQDDNADGIIERTQHNTYDINFEGANTFVGTLYLAALRAGEEMARRIADTAFADRCRTLFESGRDQTVKRLWNGEYFRQDVDLKRFPHNQYGDGCLSDQLFGQGWAHQLGLGYILPKEHVQTALRSIWKYNWAPDVGPQNAAHKPERWFVSPGEAGLFTCTWPRSAYLKEGVRYREEVWTGIEYQVAGHMIWEGMVDEGLAIVRAIHDRYDPLRHNPYNEIECGDHYARAMASWGVYNALCGFEYDGPRGHVGFAPRLTPQSYRAAFTTATACGAYARARDEEGQVHQIAVRSGTLNLQTVTVAVPIGVNVRKILVPGPCPTELQWKRDAERVLVRLADAPLALSKENMIALVVQCDH